MEVRSKLYATINIAKKDLAMEEDDYRALLKLVTNRESLKSCSFEQLHMMIDAMKKKGFKTKVGAKNKSKPLPHAGDPRNKILSLWLELSELEIINDASDSALASYCKKISGVGHWHWLTDRQCSKIIETLKAWRHRVLQEREKEVTSEDGITARTERKH